ncbi:MAG TPA: DUF2785 domain-containing protein [Methanocella sp.]|jgi:hypothetical protein
MPGTGTELKALLKVIQDNDYRIGDHQNHFVLSQEMIAHLGSTDPELRDDLIYDIIAHWIEADLLDAGQLKQILDVCQGSSHLFYRIGESGTDSVFTRSFSLLVSALVINAHRRHAFLSSSELQAVKSRIEDYLSRERDLRGYVDGKGWAHAVAHAADVLGELAQCPSITDPAEMLAMLAAIKGRMETNDYAYIHEEDERMVSAVVHIMERKILPDQAIARWIESFPETRKIGKYPDDLYLRANVKAFLRSLYLRLSKIDDAAPMLVSLREKLNKVSRF